MSKLFNMVQIRKPKSNLFDLSHEKKLTANMGDLVPVLIEEVVPGDKFRVNTEMLMRLAPMTSPVMHRVNSFLHYFFVPNRLVFDGWETFITGGEDGKQTAVLPGFNVIPGEESSIRSGTLWDYMGLPTPVSTVPTITKSIAVNAIPFRAYQLIYNEYYRDQNLTPKVAIEKGSTVSGTEKTALLTLRKRAWEKDYFTSALPWSQRGGDVSLPIQPDYKELTEIFNAADGTVPPDDDVMQKNGRFTNAAGNIIYRVENLESGGSITVNDLRQATRLQEWLEKNARAGSRYIEQILSHFGVSSSNKLLQRPQYLGGGKTPITISEVLSTFNNETVPGAQMYGHGISVGNTNKFQHFFEEHGFIVAILSTLPRTAYQQGQQRYWTKWDKFDYYWPEFANLGEQAVKLREVYYPFMSSVAGDEEKTFGYQSRYAEYKFNFDQVNGDFKEDLVNWHFGRRFLNEPMLNTSFIEANPSHEPFAVTDASVHKLYIQLYHNIKARRCMPVFGTPTL